MSEFSSIPSDLSAHEADMSQYMLERTVAAADILMRAQGLRDKAARMQTNFDVVNTWDPREVVVTVALRSVIQSGMIFLANRLEARGLDLLPPEL